MKNKLLLALLVLCHFCYGQAGNRVKVPGTKCTIIPPENFEASTTFGGFQDAGIGASITIDEIPLPYQLMMDKLTDDSYKKKGVMVVSRQIIDFRDTKATYICTSEEAMGTTYLRQILFFGDANHAIMATASYPVASKSIETKVKQSLLSVIYNPAQETQIQDAATYTIDVKNTDLKLAHHSSKYYLYSTDGRVVTDKPTLLTSSAMSEDANQNRDGFAREKFNSLPKKDVTDISQIRKVVIDNLDGYEIVGSSKIAGDLHYLLVLFDADGNHYEIIGHACENTETYLQTFKKVAKTFKRK